ncbi:PAS domain-containing protein [Haloplanus natans]|uniref:PAS domain-containing protein n=1 Tax=Haloplanus natans TaxID=376171 RepID=UPI000A076C37|nr:PAS domain-containing protein [Haloplanus natans]
MSEKLTDGESTEYGDGDSPVVDEPRVLLFMGPGRNRELLAETLGERYHVETATDSPDFETGFDCCVLGHDEFGRATDAIEAVREGTSVFLPFVLLVPADTDVGGTPWEYVDDVIELPAGKAQLHARVGNLVERRRTAVELDERSQELAATVADLRLKERAMDEAPVGITITDPDREDNPMVYVNDRFESLTGYDRSEALGRSFRFLQGEDTDPRTRRLLRERIGAETPVAVDIVNYRKNGERMWQKLDIAPVRDEDGAVTNFVGFQTEITDRKLRERRLEVLNRVLSHNLKNKMNVIEGHVALLEEEFGGDPPASLDAITDAARDLMGLAEAVRETEHIIAADESPRGPLELTEHVVRLVNVFEDRYPGATITTALPEEPCRVEATGLIAAVEEAIDNAIKHDESSTPTVDVRVETRRDWVDIEIADEGPGIPEQEIQVLESGETPLNHADRLGIWLMYWAVTKAGGRFEVGESAAGGSVVTMSVPLV